MLYKLHRNLLFSNLYELCWKGFEFAGFKCLILYDAS